MTGSLEGRRVGVLGLGRSGSAAARLAIDRGAEVYASDGGSGDAAVAAAERLRKLGAAAETGRHDVERLASCDFIVLSPGIPPSAPVLNEPAISSVPVISELEFAFGELRAPVIAITGTNGKTTVTALAAHLLRAAGLRAMSGGNIGTALSEVALDDKPDVVVVEASSFQLSRVREFAPQIGILTNLAPDHLDWYDDVEDYYADKAQIFRNARESSRWILNGEDDRVRRLPGDAPGERFWFYVEGEPAPGERGGWLDDGVLTLRLERGADEPLLPAADLSLLGPHNHANALAAALAARLFGAGAAAISEGLRGFPPLPHRMEPVREARGVLWINDSKATNVASTLVALRSVDRPMVLLLGGRHKGEPYTRLLPAMQGRVKRVIAYGEAAPRIAEDLGAELEVDRVGGSMEEVVARAGEAAEKGDAVLLSPACSSYDMFRDFEERGDRFRELVNGLSA